MMGVLSATLLLKQFGKPFNDVMIWLTITIYHGLLISQDKVAGFYEKTTLQLYFKLGLYKQHKLRA
jgi:hypothetical protein